MALAIGVFDGLHRGHQEVIEAACEHAAQHHGTAVVMSFDPHPVRVLRPHLAPRLLNGLGHQLHLLAGLGVSHTLVCPFNETVAAWSAAEFVEQLVNACQPLGCISVGYTWAFGKGREGNIHALMDLGQKHDFAVYGVPPIKLDGQVVSSTLIREAVQQGRLDEASRLLGRSYSLFGVVVQGRQLARQWGFPTANVAFDAEVLPPFGVYTASVAVEGRWCPAIANLGMRPTVDGTAPALEVHLLKWQGDLYGRALEVRLMRQVRPEKQFASLDELKAQIERDVALVSAELL